jgi:GT2 family glycosyltransferase
MSVDVSIIIVNYNSRDYLYRCVESILKSITINYELIVVDNNSDDTSLKFITDNHDLCGRIKLIVNRENYGFAIANNIGVEHSDGKILHFLNPDTIVSSALNAEYEKIIKYNQGAIFVTPLKNEDSKIIKSYYLLPFIVNYAKYLFDRDKALFWYIGASVIMKKEIFEYIGRWPTDYFMYAEDLDLFYKASLLNIPVEKLNVPILHISKGVTKNVWSEFYRLIKIQNSYLKFSKKYNKLFDYWIVNLLSIFNTMFKKPQLALLQIKVLYSVHSPLKFGSINK